ncbi:MAG: 50S ribosomal protein L4 [Candidatus Micrarchaeota archaeon]
MKADVYSNDGKKSGEISLPSLFEEPVRLGLIARAAISDQTKQYQPKAPYKRAGMQTSAKYRGRKDDYGSIKNKGIAMLPREVLPKGRFGKVRRIPSSVKGRRAHPPKVEKIIIEKINKKEYMKALRSALAATASSEYIIARGHKLPAKFSLPIIFDETCENIEKTKIAQKLLNAIGINDDLKRGKKSKKRSGVRTRKGGKRRPKSLLLVVEDAKSKFAHAARNIAGIDVVSAKELKVLDLAPGAKAGRLAAYTKKALDELAKK